MSTEFSDTMAPRHFVELTAVLGVAALANAMGHHGKAHVLHPRQDADLLDSSAVDASPASSDIPVLSVTVRPIPVDPSATPTTGVSSIGANGSMPIFPSTTIQEPVATVCPGGQAAMGSGLMSILPFPSISGMSVINATAVLEDGSTTVFSSGVTSTSGPASSISFAPADVKDARVVVDNNGCQTLFAPRVKGVCSTVVSPLGIPEVTVTDCDQYITFSSNTQACLTASIPIGSPIPLPSPIPLDGSAAEPLADSAAPASVADPAAAQKRDESDSALAAAGAADATITPAVDSALLPLPTVPTSRGCGTYYACAWYDAARGGVPPRVRAVECSNDDVVGGGAGAAGCTTYEESWSVTSFARTVTETKPISYSGVRVLPRYLSSFLLPLLRVFDYWSSC